jgi:hypothetical protein
MTNIVLIFAVAVFLYWYFIFRKGSISFWKIVASNPDQAYEYFISNSCWKVLTGEPNENDNVKIDSSDWSGPYSLIVPKLGNRMIKIYGKVGYFEDSQEEFINLLKNNKG